jgi:hypothetical protein
MASVRQTEATIAATAVATASVSVLHTDTTERWSDIDAAAGRLPGIIKRAVMGIEDVARGSTDHPEGEAAPLRRGYRPRAMQVLATARTTGTTTSCRPGGLRIKRLYC